MDASSASPASTRPPSDLNDKETIIMNPQFLLMCIIGGLFVSFIWHSLLASPSLWRKRKNLSEEQRARLYFW